jgi:hypothetical protein
MVTKTWKQLGHNINRQLFSDSIDSGEPVAKSGIALMVDWCADNLPELDRIYAMEKAIEAQQDEIDSLVRQLKGDSE